MLSEANAVVILQRFFKYKVKKRYKSRSTLNFRAQKRSILSKITISSVIGSDSKTDSKQIYTTNQIDPKLSSLFRLESRKYLPAVNKRPGSRNEDDLTIIYSLLKREPMFMSLKLTQQNINEIGQAMEYILYDGDSLTDLIYLKTSFIVIFNGTLLVESRLNNQRFEIATLVPGTMFGINPYENEDVLIYSSRSSVSIFTLNTTSFIELLSKWGLESYRDTANFLVKLPGLSMLTSDQLQWLTTNVAFHEIPFNTSIFTEGDLIKFDCFIPIIRKGEVKVLKRIQPRKSQFVFRQQSLDVIELCRLGPYSLFISDNYLELWGDEFTNVKLDQKYALHIRQECTLVTTSPCLVGYIPKEIFFLLPDHCRNILSERCAIYLPNNDQMHEICADYRTWNILKTNIINSTIRESSAKKSFSKLPYFNSNRENMSRSNTRPRSECALRKDSSNSKFIDPNALVYPAAQGATRFSMNIRKPMDTQPFGRGQPITGSPWFSSPPPCVYKYMGYTERHSPNNLPSINCTVNFANKRKSKFLLPNEIPYIDMNSVFYNHKRNVPDQTPYSNRLVKTSQIVKRKQKPKYSFNNHDYNVSAISSGRRPINIKDIVSSIFADIEH